MSPVTMSDVRTLVALITLGATAASKLPIAVSGTDYVDRRGALKVGARPPLRAAGAKWRLRG